MYRDILISFNRLKLSKFGVTRVYKKSWGFSNLFILLDIKIRKTASMNYILRYEMYKLPSRENWKKNGK